MRRFIKKRSKKAGLPPGTLIHIGEPRSGEVRTTVVEYDEGHFQEREWDTPEGCYVFPPRPTVTWINVDGIHQKDLVEKLGECFRLHPLVQEDILNTDQRPKVEDYGEDLFIVVKRLSYDERTEEIAAEQVSLVLRPEVVLSFQEKVGDAFRRGEGTAPEWKRPPPADGAGCSGLRPARPRRGPLFRGAGKTGGED